MDNKNVYYFHSPFDHNVGTRQKRASVCGIYDDATNTMKIGVSICSESDNFARADGRQRAEKRANSGMKVIESDTINAIKKLHSDTTNLDVFITIAKNFAEKALTKKNRNLKIYDEK